MLHLPPPDETQLPNSPLSLAVCQVQFEETLLVNDSRFILELHRLLGGREGAYPQIERVQGSTVDIRLGPDTPQPMSLQETGWRLLSKDKHWTISIMPNYAALETSKYTTWSDDFKVRLHQLLDVVANQINPATERRLGLRYIDRLTEPIVQTPQGWDGYIAPELLGPILHEGLGPAVKASQQQIDLGAGDEVQCSLRHGVYSDPTHDGACTYVLDFDVYRNGIRAFDVAEIKATVKSFHELSLQLFQQAITPRLLDFLKREDRHE